MSEPRHSEPFARHSEPPSCHSGRSEESPQFAQGKLRKESRHLQNQRTTGILPSFRSGPPVAHQDGRRNDFSASCQGGRRRENENRLFFRGNELSHLVQIKDLSILECAKRTGF